MIDIEKRLVVHFEEEESTLMLGDLRRFLAECEAAPDDTSVEWEQRLFDGRVADVIAVMWIN